MDETLARQVAALCQDLHARAWVANHDGNVSVRLGDGRFLASPTAVSKRDVRPESLVVVDGEGKVVQGTRRVFSEMALHLAAYRARPDVSWVVHAHPPHATAWAVAGESFWDAPFLAEAVVSLGDSVPLVSYAMPGSSTAALEAAISRADAVLLGNHGVLTVGPDAETALLRMELVEHLARIAALARPLGGARPLPAEDVAKLLDARRKAGLGPEGRANAGLTGAGTPPLAPPTTDVEALVRDALRRLG
ncbi:aldolase [Deltaproteobacteria bacterium]|nr:aldolase [Deltaproteobacteria bacterium]